MIHANLDAEPILIAESGEEFRTLAAGVAGDDPEFADELKLIADLTEVCGLNPDSTRFAGARAVQLVEGLRIQTGIRAAHGLLMLETATTFDLSDLEGDPIKMIASLPLGPHSAVITDDQAHTGFRRVPLIIQ